MPDAPDLTGILDAIRVRPDDGDRWLNLASWLGDNGRYDEAVAVRVYWPTLRDNITECGVPLGLTLRQMARHAAVLGRQAREFEQGLHEWLADEPTPE